MQAQGLGPCAGWGGQPGIQLKATVRDGQVKAPGENWEQRRT